MAAKKTLSLDDFYNGLKGDDKEAIVNLKDKKIDFIPTGSWVLNYLIGDGTNSQKPGGFPRGHIVEIAGDESCGKSTLALSACKQAQDLGGHVAFLDFERTFHEFYAKKLGIDLDPKRFVLVQPDHFQQGASFIQNVLATGPMLIVVDSVSAMTPKQYIEGDVDEMGRIGLQAQLMSTLLPIISKDLTKRNTCLLFTNQLRSLIKLSKYDPGPDEETSGGKAIRYYSAIRIRMKKKTVEKINVKSIVTGKEEKEPINVMIQTTVVKNRIDKPHMTGPVYIRFGEGIDNIISIIELAKNTNVIKTNGTYLRFTEDGKKDGKVLFNAQGKENLRKILDESPDILEKLTSKLSFSVDEEAQKEFAEEEEPQESSDLENKLDQAAEKFIKKGKKK